MKVAKPVVLYKGIVKSSKVKKRIGLPWYSVNIILAPGIIVKHFLSDPEMNYVQHEKNAKLNAEFIMQDSDHKA
jgi:hypothetical protein